MLVLSDLFFILYGRNVFYLAEWRWKSCLIRLFAGKHTNTLILSAITTKTRASCTCVSLRNLQIFDCCHRRVHGDFWMWISFIMLSIGTAISFSPMTILVTDIWWTLGKNTEVKRILVLMQWIVIHFIGPFSFLFQWHILCKHIYF